MPTSRRHDPNEPLHQPTEEEFEELVAAALKVDPKGVSGKHRTHPPAEEAMSAIMDTGPHPAEEWEDEPKESRPEVESEAEESR